MLTRLYHILPSLCWCIHILLTPSYEHMWGALHTEIEHSLFVQIWHFHISTPSAVDNMLKSLVQCLMHCPMYFSISN